MSSEILLGVRLTPVEKMSVIKLSDIDLKEKVERLRNQAAGETNLSNDAFDLIYSGCLLENDCTLESYGLKSGSMVHVLKKREEKETINTNATTVTHSEANVEMLTSVFKSFIGNPLLELAMRRLTKRPEIIENIISSSPGLNEDAVAIAILQDPDLIIHFTNAETIKKIARLHPALLEAAQNIASAVHDEAHSFAATSTSISSSSLSNAHASGHSYSLENLSDDEEMAADSSQSSDSTQPSNSINQSRNESNSTISAAELLAAITRARRSTSANTSGVAGGSSPLTSGSRPNSNSGGVITFEMFNQAMQQAFASAPLPNDQVNPIQSPPSSIPPVPFTASQNTSPDNDMQRQITIMHEMGLENDAINIQALQITNGDVQAAIELVLSGFGDN